MKTAETKKSKEITEKKNILHHTFSSLKIRNYRIYYIGQMISVSGTFLQALAQDWLVLKLTNSGTMLGLVLFFQFFPMLLLTFYGGVLVDRFRKLKILYFTQTIAAFLALGLGLLVLTGLVQIWMVFIFALCLGIVNSIDDPARKAFVYEMVGKDEVKNAVSLWTILISLTRVIGPALAGVLILTIGIGQCFIINSISYIAVIASLFMIQPDKLHTVPPQPAAKGQIREGLKYVKSTPVLFNPLIMMAIIGTIAFEWQASLPLFAKFVLHGDAGTYAAITAALGIGMLIGGFIIAGSKRISQKMLVYSAFFFGLSILIVAVMTSLIFALIAFVIVGFFSIAFANLSNSLLQINTDSKMRGRVMSMWTFGFQASTAVGGPLIGWIGESFGAQWSLAVGGIAALIASIIGFIYMKKKNLN